MSDWLIPYLVFNGNCEQAVNFYAQVLEAEPVIMRYGDAPPNPHFQVPEEVKSKVMHAELRKDGHVIRFSDNCFGAPVNTGNSISFSLEFKSVEDTKAMFQALSEGGKVEMEPQETFFSPCYSKFTDKFGIMWQVSCTK